MTAVIDIVDASLTVELDKDHPNKESHRSERHPGDGDD
jgi:hypothetical protein